MLRTESFRNLQLKWWSKIWLLDNLWLKFKKILNLKKMNGGILMGLLMSALHSLRLSIKPANLFMTLKAFSSLLKMYIPCLFMILTSKCPKNAKETIPPYHIVKSWAVNWCNFQVMLQFNLILIWLNIVQLWPQIFIVLMDVDSINIIFISLL